MLQITEIPVIAVGTRNGLTDCEETGGIFVPEGDYAASGRIKSTFRIRLNYRTLEIENDVILSSFFH